MPESARLWEVMHKCTTLIMSYMFTAQSGSLKLNVKCVGEAVKQSKINCSTYVLLNRGIISGKSVSVTYCTVQYLLLGTEP